MMIIKVKNLKTNRDKNNGDKKCAKTFSFVGNCTRHEKKFGHFPTITTKVEKLLHDEAAKLYQCPHKECSSTSGDKRNVQRHLEECCNYAKQAEAVVRNKVCDYCGMTFCKRFNRDRHVQNVHESDVADSILSVCESSALNLKVPIGISLRHRFCRRNEQFNI